ncbi:MAG: transcription antitermination factor NusB [Planctomycetota bacterium]
MRKRTLSREIALQLLYEFEVAGLLQNERITTYSHDRKAPQDTKEYTQRLIEGVRQNINEIDSYIEEFAENWHISRMPLVDKTILRMGAWELVFCGDVPPKVAINEAVDLAKRFGGADSGSFVNAILDKIFIKFCKKEK